MKGKLLTRGLIVLACLCVVGLACRAAMGSQDVKPVLQSDPIQMDTEGWSALQGGGLVPAALGQTVAWEGDSYTLVKEIDPAEMQKTVLLFQNNRQSVTVRADGQVLYSLGAEDGRAPVTASGYCAVPLPQTDGAYRLEIEFSRLRGSCEVPELYFGSTNDVLVFLLPKDMISLAALPLWLVLGIAMAVMAVFLLRWQAQERRLISLSLFLICVALWSFTDMTLITLLPVSMEVNSVVSHCLIMLMAMPILYFIHWSCPHRRLRMRLPLMGLILGNILLQCGLYLLKVASLHQMVWLSQGILVLLLFYGVAAMVLDHRTTPTDIGKLQILAMSSTAVLACVAIVLYWKEGSHAYHYQSIFQIMVVVFLSFILCVVMYSAQQQNTEIQMKAAELNALRNVSTVDQLTGMKNRRAFEEKLQEIQQDRERYPDALLVFMSVKGLRYANDSYGHLAGDELIAAAGKCVYQSFDPVGISYRIGGDEFAAIIEGTKARVAECYERMDRAVAQYNETASVPLSISRGYSALLSPSGQRLSVSEWKMFADRRMQEDGVVRQSAVAAGSAEDYLGIIASFVSAVDAKDSYTADHSKRVALLADWICTRLELPKEVADQVHMAACLHDIGKIGIPDRILCKTERLTREEWQILQSHAVIGEEIVRRAKAFEEVGRIIRHHHESYDGSGYPDGVKGGEIPLGARIVALADSIDAMTSSRSYRSAKSFAYCRDEIRKGLGTRYDPEIGKAVLEHWPEVETMLLAEMGKSRAL